MDAWFLGVAFERLRLQSLTPTDQTDLLPMIRTSAYCRNTWIGSVLTARMADGMHAMSATIPRTAQPLDITIRSTGLTSKSVARTAVVTNTAARIPTSSPNSTHAK